MLASTQMNSPSPAASQHICMYIYILYVRTCDTCDTLDERVPVSLSCFVNPSWNNALRMCVLHRCRTSPREDQEEVLFEALRRFRLWSCSWLFRRFRWSVVFRGFCRFRVLRWVWCFRGLGVSEFSFGISGSVLELV